VRPIYRTGVPLPSRCCILYIFSTNISTSILNMLHTLRFYLQNAVYFIMLHFCFMYYSHFTYRVCTNLNVKLRCQKFKYFSIKLHPHHLQPFLLNHLFDIWDLNNGENIMHISSTFYNIKARLPGVFLY
jgi:hypothetical protein